MLELEVHASMIKLERTAITSVLLLWISIRFLFSSVSCSQIPLGSRLSSQENSYWVSPNGYFEIGFFNYSCQHTFGIRFSSSFFPDNEHDAVVWVAGGNIRVAGDSYVELTHNGELILYSSATGGIAWISNSSNADIESAVLRDDGNFVLLNQKNEVVWQSFSSPSDTLLPGQNLSVSNFLRASSKSPDDSHYTLYMNVSGELQLRWDMSIVYWTLGDPSRPAVRAILNDEGILQGHDQRSKVIWSIFGEDFSDRDVKFRFLKLDFDGNLRLYSWRNDSRSWRSVWQAFDNQCKVFATCGLHGVCLFNSTASHICDCPFTSTGDSSSSECLVPYQPNCSSGISMIRHDHMFLYGIFPPNETVVQTSLQHCQRLCEEDSLCYAVSFINDGVPQCRIKKSQYVSGWVDRSSSSISFVKTCSNPIAVLPTEKDNKADSSSEICKLCLIEVSMASVLAFIVIQLGIGLYIHRRRRYVGKKAVSLNLMPNASGCIMLSYLQIQELTGNFKNQIGPKMFKGVLPSKRLVVIKDLNISIEERKFRNAVLRIGNIHHRNLVKLEAFCCESNYRFLVYEFAKNGSLDKCLGDPKICKRLTWRKRINICLSVARAMSYLHTGCREFVNHGNLKCENVVLDNDLEAKVSEFGLRALLPEPSNNEGRAETDVRDFGTMMLVLITGNQNACKWAYGKWAGGELETIADKQMESGIDSGEVERALRLAFWCLQGDERMRPSMGEIVKVLEGTLAVDPPPPLFGHPNQHPMPTPSPSPSSPGT